jgi:hypothetical protein
VRLHRRQVLADLHRHRLGMSEGDVSLDRHKSLRGRVLVMASGATAFAQISNRASTVGAVSPTTKER